MIQGRLGTCAARPQRLLYSLALLPYLQGRRSSHPAVLRVGGLSCSLLVLDRLAEAVNYLIVEGSILATCRLGNVPIQLLITEPDGHLEHYSLSQVPLL